MNIYSKSGNKRKFSSRWYLCARKSPCAFYLISEVSWALPLKWVVLPASLSAQSFPITPACPGQYIHRSFRRWLSTIDTFHFSLFVASSLNLLEWWHVTVTSWGNPAEGMSDCFHLHCQTGGWDCKGCTVFMDGVVAHCLTVKPHPDWSFVTEPSVYTMRSCGLLLLFFEWKAWSLTLFCLLAILDCAFPSFLAGVSYRDARISLGTFPTPWFAWALSAAILAVLSPLLDPSKTCPIPACIPLCLSRLHGVGCGDFRQHWSMLWLAPLSVWFTLVGGLA